MYIKHANVLWAILYTNRQCSNALGTHCTFYLQNNNVHVLAIHFTCRQAMQWVRYICTTSRL